MTNHPIKVAILGCGPAGLFAAHAAAMAEADVTIFSKARKSFMRGAQYLHRPIPGLSGESFEVEYQLWSGNEEDGVEGYRKKVYGDMGDVLVSPQTLVGVAPAWDIREAYDKAWELYGDKVVDVDFAEMGDSYSFLRNLATSYDLVVSTIPAPVLCHMPSEHKFYSQKVWVTEGLKRPMEMGFQLAGTGVMRDNLVVCSGDPDDWWYRQSRIHGWENTEFPHDRRPAGNEHKVHEVEKPLRHTCICHPDIVRMGRYGQWRKGVLSHEAFEDTAREIVALEQGWVA